MKGPLHILSGFWFAWQFGVAAFAMILFFLAGLSLVFKADDWANRSMGIFLALFTAAFVPVWIRKARQAVNEHRTDQEAARDQLACPYCKAQLTKVPHRSPVQSCPRCGAML